MQLYLLQQYNIKTKLESYHEYNQDIKTDVIINVSIALQDLIKGSYHLTRQSE